MRNRASRSLVVGLILSLPPLMLLVTPASAAAPIVQPATLTPWSMVVLVDGLIIVGLNMAWRERERLLRTTVPRAILQDTPFSAMATNPIPSRPIAPAWRTEALVS